MLEQLPALRDALARGQDWGAIASAQLGSHFASSAERKRQQAEELAALYSSPAVERLLTGPGQNGGAQGGADAWGAAGGGSVGECTLRLEFKRAPAAARAAGAGVTAAAPDDDDDASDDEEEAAAAGGGPRARGAVALTAKGREPAFQTVFEVESASAAVRLPSAGDGAGSLCARATLYAQDGRELASTAEGGDWSAALALPAAGKAKGWLQLGHEPTRPRVQLLVVRAPGGSGGAFVLGSVRVTAPERHSLRLEFVPETSGAHNTAVVVAEGCALAGASQALFRPTGGTGNVPLPASCRVRGELRAGERVWRAADTRLELSAERPLQWAQVGKGPEALRLQLRLRQAVHAGVIGARRARAAARLPPGGAAGAAFVFARALSRPAPRAPLPAPRRPSRRCLQGSSSPRST